MSWKREKPSALSYSIHYLSYRPRSVAEVVFALKKKKYSPAEIDRVITELLEKGLLDDRSFSESWINYRKHQSVRSRSFVRQELHMKGVAASVAEVALEEYYPAEEEREILLPLLTRQWQSVSQRFAGAGQPLNTDTDGDNGSGVDDDFMDIASEGTAMEEKIAEKLLRKYAGKGFSPYLVREVLAEVRAEES